MWCVTDDQLPAAFDLTLMPAMLYTQNGHCAWVFSHTHVCTESLRDWTVAVHMWWVDIELTCDLWTLVFKCGPFVFCILAFVFHNEQVANLEKLHVGSWWLLSPKCCTCFNVFYKILVKRVDVQLLVFIQSFTCALSAWDYKEKRNEQPLLVGMCHMILFSLPNSPSAPAWWATTNVCCADVHLCDSVLGDFI